MTKNLGLKRWNNAKKGIRKEIEMIFINPGSEGVENATEENAIENMKHFVVDLNKDVEVIRYAEKDYNNDDGDGRYCFILKHKNCCYEIQMPGLPLEQVRYMNSETQNVWDYPRLYLDGESWIWAVALNVCTFKSEEEMSEEEMKALVEMNNMLKYENTKLKQDKSDEKWKDEYFELMKYRLAWNELKENCADNFGLLKDLSKKYNLGGEQDENDTLTTGIINNDRITISNCVYYEEPLLERIDKLQIENEKLKQENERLKQYKEDNFLYDFEELQDKVLKLQKDNQELKRIVEAYKDKEDKLRDYIEHNVGLNMNDMEYVKKQLLQILNEGDK